MNREKSPHNLFWVGEFLELPKKHDKKETMQRQGVQKLPLHIVFLFLIVESHPFPFLSKPLYDSPSRRMTRRRRRRRRRKGLENGSAYLALTDPPLPSEKLPLLIHLPTSHEMKFFSRPHRLSSFHMTLTVERGNKRSEMRDLISRNYRTNKVFFSKYFFHWQCGKKSEFSTFKFCWLPFSSIRAFFCHVKYDIGREEEVERDFLFFLLSPPPVLSVGSVEGTKPLLLLLPSSFERPKEAKGKGRKMKSGLQPMTEPVTHTRKEGGTQIRKTHSFHRYKRKNRMLQKCYIGMLKKNEVGESLPSYSPFVAPEIIWDGIGGEEKRGGGGKKTFGFLFSPPLHNSWDK